MNLTYKENAIHVKALEVSQRFFQAEMDLIEVLQAVDQSRLSLKFERTSLFQYAVKELRLSESVAGIYISVARKALMVPELQKALKAKTISVSVAVKLVSSITSENAPGLLEFARSHSCREIERHVMGVNPSLKAKEKVSVVSQGLMKVSFTLTNEEYESLCRARDLESQRTGKASSFKETLVVAVQDYLEKRDPVRKAQRSKVRTEKKESRVKEGTFSKMVGEVRGNGSTSGGEFEKEREPIRPSRELSKGGARTSHEGFAGMCRPRNEGQMNQRGVDPGRAVLKRIPLKAHEEHAVFLKTKGVCSYIDRHGERCTEGRWVHIHHLVPVSAGGGNDPENLRLLCSRHHDLVHQMELPLEEMDWLQIRELDRIWKCGSAFIS